MRIVITGAAGKIGKEVIEELTGDHQLCLVDKVPLSKEHSIVADLAHAAEKNSWNLWPARRCCWREAFERADVIVHLAADSSPEAAWDSLLTNNIHATWNVLETAAQYGVPRVIFASSNFAVKSIERSLAPGCYRPDGPKISSNVPPCPITSYGISKAFGEITGRTFVDEQKLRSFLAVRIGHYNTTPSEIEEWRRLWIGPEDIRRFFRRCVEAEYVGFHVVYGVSAQTSAPYDLSHTTQLLSWVPRQFADNGTTALKSS